MPPKITTPAADYIRSIALPKGSALIYALVDPRDGMQRYIGKTTNPYARYRTHLQDRSDRRNARWIRSLLDLGLEPEFVVIEIAGDENWADRERYWIKELRLNNPDGVNNHCDGGLGLHNPSTETRETIGRNMRKRWLDNPSQMLQMVRDRDRCKHISDALKGRPKSPEHVSKLPQNQIGYKHSDEFREKISASMIGNKNASGAVRSDETKASISRSLKGHVVTEETKEKMRKPRSLEQKERMRKPKSLEHRENMRQAALLRWQKARGGLS